MSKIELTDTHMLVKLTLGEKILGLHGDFKIPAALIRGAEVADKNVWQTFGMRIGTGLPWILVYGHYWWPDNKKRTVDKNVGGWTFALWRSKTPSLTITLAKAPGQPYKRMVLTTPDAQKLADQINDAIVACQERGPIVEAYQPQYEGSPNPVAIVGIHLAKKGLSGAIACDFKRISRKKASFKALKDAFKADYGVDFETTSSSTGKEPCVLAKFDDGSTAMLLDARDLALVDGDMKKFDKNLRAKMLFFF